MKFTQIDSKEENCSKLSEYYSQREKKNMRIINSNENRSEDENCFKSAENQSQGKRKLPKKRTTEVVSERENCSKRFNNFNNTHDRENNQGPSVSNLGKCRRNIKMLFYFF